ncbi:MAG: FAD:protein FMN transferase [Gemmatimonadales bacterium]
MTSARRGFLIGAAVGMAAGGGCRTDPRTTTVTAAWQMLGSTVSVAAWGKDSAAVRAAIARMRDSTRAVDSTAAREAVRRAWAVERGDLRLRPEWRDVADGYVLDRAAPVLAAAVDSALIDLGGLFLWVGPASSRVVGIANPGNSLDPIAQLDLRSGALSTVSGRGERRSVTVLAGDAFRASAWASALFSLGCDRILASAARWERQAVSVVCADSSGVRWTTDLQNRVLLPAVRAP